MAPGIAEDVNIAELPLLSEAWVGQGLARSAVENPAIKYLSIESLNHPARIVGRLKSLALECKTIDLNAAENLSELMHIGLVTPGAVDVARLSEARGLQSVFVRATDVAHIEVLLDLPKLKQVTLSGLESAPGYPRLSELKLESFRAEPNYVFDDDFRSAVSGRDGWYFAPQLEPPVARVISTPLDHR